MEHVDSGGIGAIVTSVTRVRGEGMMGKRSIILPDGYRLKTSGVVALCDMYWIPEDGSWQPAQASRLVGGCLWEFCRAS